MVDKKELKNLLRSLRSEADLPHVREKAKRFLRNVDPKLLSLAEQELIEEGISRKELRRLCDIHLELLSQNIAKAEVGTAKNHPMSLLRREHDIILKNLDSLETILKKANSCNDFKEIRKELEQLRSIAHVLIDAESHHEREEKALFPRLEKQGITGPPSIMRMEHTDLRKRKKALGKLVEDQGNMSYEQFADELNELAGYILNTLRSHIFKENNILYPTAAETLQENEWEKIKMEFDNIGYCCFTPKK